MFMKMLAQSFASDFYYINYPLPSFRLRKGNSIRMVIVCNLQIITQLKITTLGIFRNC